jgi:hypothetical protein
MIAKKQVRAIALLLCCCGSRLAQSYELATHAQMVEKAFERSVLSSNVAGSVISQMGLSQWLAQNPKFPLRSGSSPVGGIAVSTDFWIETGALSGFQMRFTYDYELTRMPAFLQESDPLKINGWLIRGGVREDDGGIFAAWNAGEPYLRDIPLGGRINRFCNHFFDPIASRDSPPRSSAFTGFCPNPGNLAPLDSLQWGLGALNPFDTSPTEIVNRANHFTVSDARELMWRALTLKTREGAPADPTFIKGEDRRKVYWASAFRTLGAITHLLQDAAQPQHTRDEGHGPGIFAGYEEYIAARSTRALDYEVNGRTYEANYGKVPPELDLTSYLDSYGAPKFARYSDYWRGGPDSRRVGLADYSNRGFYTPGNNVGSAKYRNSGPNVDPAAGRRLIDESFLSGFKLPYVFGTVHDDLSGTTDTIALSTEGLFKVQGGPLVVTGYKISRRNLDDHAGLLIPRAVAYSVGLINYFFRGQLQIGVPGVGVYGIVDHYSQSTKDTGGFSKLLIKVANLTASISPSNGGDPQPQDMTGGKLVAVVKFHRNNCYQSDLSGEYGSPEVIASKGTAARGLPCSYRTHRRRSVPDSPPGRH